MGRRIDIAGKKFSRLTAIKDVGKNKHGSRLWECQCGCGNTKVVQAQRLKSGHTKSCGCLKIDSPNNILPKGESAFNTLLLSYKNRAKRRGYKFELSKDEFRELTSSNCYYCGAEPTKKQKAHQYSNGTYLYNGIDRIDSSQGYIVDNCVPCCWMCNQMKKAYTQQEFIKQATKISENSIKRAKDNG